MIDLEQLPAPVLQRAQEIVGLSGELLDPEVAVLVALREADKLPLPAPGLHHDLMFGVFGEGELRASLDPANRSWLARSGEAEWRVRFEAGPPPWAAPQARFRFVGAQADAREKGLVRIPPGALLVPIFGAVQLDPSAPAAGLNDVEVEGRLLGLEPSRSFLRRDGGRGFVARARVETDRGAVEVTLWDLSLIHI